ncbi:MAG: NADH-ubiquinone oxidoreductase-F iron-sulfur binding region domain-containing protein [bacterium]
MPTIIEKLYQTNLHGRGGAAFPTAKKWEILLQQQSEKKYIIANGSEGEPYVYKDEYILTHHPEQLIKGIEIALKTIDKSTAYLYLRTDYFDRFKASLEKHIGNLPITLFRETSGYLGGEETTLINTIEDAKVIQPRSKPPLPLISGLWNYPTLINNIETFYDVAQIDQGTYKETRLYSITSEGEKKGVFELPEHWTIQQVLEHTNMLPTFDFFTQIGGSASGEILLSDELNIPVTGSGAIIIYNKTTTDPFALMQRWLDFFFKENCDKCLPCREGVYRLREMINTKNLNESLLSDLFFTTQKTCFCPLGKSVHIPISSLLKKVCGVTITV